MNISAKGVSLIKNFEGCRLTAYRCSAGVWTIGWGHTSGVKAGQKITQEQADNYLMSDLTRFVNHVNYYHNIYHFNQNQFDALVSFAFNIGSISQLTNNGKRSIKEISEKMLLYVNAGGKKNQGLVNRRKKEQELFLLGVEASTVELPEPTLRTNCKGVRVQALQTILNNRYKTGLVIDGIYGKKTKEAVKVMQKALFNNVKEIDGIYGPKTYNALKGVL